MITSFPFIFTFVCIFGGLFVVFGLICESRDMGITSVLLVSFFSGALGGSVVFVASEKIGALSTRLTFGRLPGKSNFDDKLFSEYEVARQRKEEGRLGEALHLLEETLRKSPEFPHALCLKAQILWEGYRNLAAAKRYIRRAMQVLSVDDDPYRWASDFHDELAGIEKMQQAGQPPSSDAAT